MKENLYRLWFLALMVGALLIFAEEILRSQEKQPPPPISLDIKTRVIVFEGRGTEIRVNWRIERHKDNRQWSFVMNSDQGDYQFSSGQIDGENDQVVWPVCTLENQRPCFRHVRPGFYVVEACVYRLGRKKPICDRITLEVR